MALTEPADHRARPPFEPRVTPRLAAWARHRWVRTILVFPLITLVAVVTVNVVGSSLVSSGGSDILFDLPLLAAALSGFAATAVMAGRATQLGTSERCAIGVTGLACNLVANYVAVYVSVVFIVSRICGGPLHCLA